MDKLLVLKFENAGIFRKYWKKSKDDASVMVSGNKDDRILSGKSRDIRKKESWIDNPIGTLHYSFVENALLVLMGKRPVPKYRSSVAVSDAAEIAKRCMVRVESLTTKNKDGVELLLFEKMTTRKALDDSWNMATPSWERMRTLLPEELFAELVSVSRDIYGENATDSLFDDVAKKLFASGDPRVTKLVDDARVARAEPLAKLLTGSDIHSLQQAGYRGLGVYLKTLVNKGVSDIARLDGSICVPLTNEELELFSHGGGFATLLEGGMVTIDKVIDLEYTTVFAATVNYKEVAV